MDLIQHYKAILESLGMSVDDAGLVSTKVADDWTPTTVNGKRLVLPTREVLSNPDWDNTIAFHPLSEKIQRGESTILKALCVFVNVRLTSVIAALMEDLMTLAVDTDRHASLKPAQLKALRGAPEAKPATLDRLIKILERVSYKGDTRIFNLYLKRGGELNDRKYVRLANVSFPIATHMFEDGEPKVFKELFGVTGLTITDSKSIFGLLNYIIPDFEKPNTYSAGTQDTEAPYFHALMLAYIKVAIQLNKVTTLMANAIRDPEDLLIDLSWQGLLDDLHSYKAKIPVLEGNEGELSEDTLTAKRAGSNLNAANMRVNSGVAGGGDSERVPYRSPIADEHPEPKPIAAKGSYDRLEHSEEVPAENKPKLSSWAKRSATLNGGVRPAIVARAGQSEGKVLLGKDSEGYPVYGDAPVPVRQQRRQEPMIETIYDDYGNPLYNGYYDQTGNFVIVDQPPPQQMMPPRRGQPAPFHQPQQFRGHPQQQRQQPMNSRQAMNSRRAAVGFPNARNNQW